jgi:hypothetical protein
MAQADGHIVSEYMAKGSLTDWIGLVIAFSGVVSALSQYAINSRRSRAIKAADEIETLNNDESAKAILRLIDWESAHISVRDETGELKSLYVSPQIFLLAIRHHSQRRDDIPNYKKNDDPFADKPYNFTIDEERIRDMLDRFLGRLERIESLIANGVIKKDDFLHFFSYWLNLMDENSTTSPTTFNSEKKRALWAYIRGYKFNGVVSLFTRFGRSIVSE